MNKRGYLIVVLLVVFLVLTTFAFAATIDQEVLDALNSQDEVSVIIVLKDQPLPEKRLGIASATDEFSRRKAMISEVQDDVLGELRVRKRDKVGGLGIASAEDYDIDLKHRYSIINGFSGRVTKKGLEKLVKSDLIEKIRPVKPIKINLIQSVPLIKANQVWNISVNGTSINGTGQTVCVIDTGVDYTHPALGGCTNTSFLNGSCSKVIGGYDFGNDDSNPMDVNSHGTHVAGIIASENNTYRGVAPGAKIVALKVFANNGSGSTDDAIAGIDWCVSNKTLFNISVITLSLGECHPTQGCPYEFISTSYCDDRPLANATNYAASQGIFVDVAAGNAANSSGIGSPACASNVTSVGSVYDANVGIAAWSACTDGSTAADQISCFTNSGNILDLLAPGAQIYSTVLSNTYGTEGGTSMAAPHVAGAAALLKQYWKAAYNINITPQQIENKLKITGVRINDTRNGITFPRIDILAAIQPFINFTSSSPANATTITATYTLINITSDVNLSTALLEWNNGTPANFTMNSSNATSFYYNMTGLTTTNYTYRVYGNDSAGTFGVSETRLIVVDQTAPNITFYTPTNLSYYRQALNLNVSLTNLQLSFSNYSIINSTNTTLQTNTNNSILATSFTWTDLVNLSNSTFSDGNYTLTVFVNDTLGNSATSSVIFTVDKTAASIINLSLHPSTVYNNDSITFRINVTDNYALNTSAVYFESNFSTNWTNYSMNNENNITFNFTLTGTSNLTNQRNIAYKFNAADLAGNINTSATYNFTVQNRIPFALNITAPINNSVIEVGNSTSFNATATDLDNDTLTYYWNFSDNTSLVTEQNTTHSFNSTGSFIVILNVSDGYSSNLTNITVIINDTKPPTISSPTYDTELHLQQDGSTLSINSTTHDYSGISNFTLDFNGTLFNGSCTTTNTTWNCNWSISDLTVGSYNFTLNYTDNFTTTHTNSSTYNFSVTSCSDSIQNGNEAGTDCGGSCSACPSSPSSSGGGGGGGGGGTGGTTYVINDAQLATGYTNTLSKGDKMKFSISNEEHYLTMESMTSVSASFNVTSKVYKVLLSIGEEMKFELDDDSYYDIKAKLNSINITAVKANLTIQKIHEAIPEQKVAVEEKVNESVASSALDAINASNTSTEFKIGITPLTVNEALGSADKNTSSWKSITQWITWKYVLEVVIVIGLVLVLVKMHRRKKKASKHRKNAYPFP
ncbi:S8 family serine peptidase [Candidatus Woesearchaeota archaeon]|nr:S8 family serine peptidase [Candidatus Woesearchaeota archaeon]